MYAPHQGAQGLRAVFEAPEFTHPRAGKTATFWALNGSASLEGRTVTLTVVNPHATEPRETQVSVRGASVRGARARVLTATDIHAQNTFENPRGVEPQAVQARHICILFRRFLSFGQDMTLPTAGTPWRRGHLSSR